MEELRSTLVSLELSSARIKSEDMIDSVQAKNKEDI